MANNPYDDILKRAQAELSPGEQQKLAEVLAQHAGRKNGGAHQVTDLRGLGKHVWQGVDADDYVAGERDSWVEDLRGKTVGLDTAPLIYYIEDHPIYAELLAPFFAAVAAG